MVVLDLAEEELKTPLRVHLIEFKASKGIGRSLPARGSAAREMQLRYPGTSFYDMIFEKRNGQKGNVGYIFDQLRPEPEALQVFFVDGVILCLEMKELQSNIAEVPFVNRR